MMRKTLIVAALTFGLLALAACSTQTPSQTQSAPISPIANTGQGGTDAAAGQLFGLGVTRPGGDGKDGGAVAEWKFPEAGGTIETPLTTLHQKFGPDGKVVEAWYEVAKGEDGKPIMQRIGSVAAYIDNRGGNITNSVTPQGTVAGSGTTQSGGANLSGSQTASQTTSVPVTATVPVTLPSGAVVPAGGIIPAGTPTSVFPPGAVITPVK